MNLFHDVSRIGICGLVLLISLIQAVASDPNVGDVCEEKDVKGWDKEYNVDLQPSGGGKKKVEIEIAMRCDKTELKWLARLCRDASVEYHSAVEVAVGKESKKIKGVCVKCVADKGPQEDSAGCKQAAGNLKNTEKKTPPSDTSVDNYKKTGNELRNEFSKSGTSNKKVFGEFS